MGDKIPTVEAESDAEKTHPRSRAYEFGFNALLVLQSIGLAFTVNIATSNPPGLVTTWAVIASFLLIVLSMVVIGYQYARSQIERSLVDNQTSTIEQPTSSTDEHGDGVEPTVTHEDSDTAPADVKTTHLTEWLLSFIRFGVDVAFIGLWVLLQWGLNWFIDNYFSGDTRVIAILTIFRILFAISSAAPIVLLVFRDVLLSFRRTRALIERGRNQ